jgi:hypothetical protein
MRAIFVARGPAFPHEPHSLVESFSNIEVYNIVCDSLGISPSPNSGTLRLPFTTQGKHDDADAPVRDDPEDLSPNEPGEGGSSPATIIESAAPTAAPSVVPVTNLDDDDEPFDDDNDIESGTGAMGKSWWEWITDGVENLVDKVKGVFGLKKDDDDGDDGDD